MRIKLLALYIAAASGVMASCGVSAPDESTSSWPSCSWPAALDPDESGSSRDHCIASRTRLDCALPGGGGLSCPTNVPDRCETADAPAAEMCVAECARNEFAATCGGVGPGPIPLPPASCRFHGLVPAGLTFYCCPCGA